MGRIGLIFGAMLVSFSAYAKPPVNLDAALDEALQSEKAVEEERKSVTQLLDPGQLEAVLESRLEEEVQLSLQLIQMEVAWNSIYNQARLDF